MKGTITTLTAAALAIALAGPAMAQMRPDAANASVNYFDSHPDVAAKLQKDPSLIDNQKFVADHPGLHEYLHDHPNVRHKFKAHPNRFMHREEQYTKRHNY